MKSNQKGVIQLLPLLILALALPLFVWAISNLNLNILKKAASIPVPLFNRDPVIITDSLPTGTVGVAYRADVTATDFNKNDRLEMWSEALPPGLTLGQCRYTINGKQAQIDCTIYGTPTQAGSFSAVLRAQDNWGAFVLKTIPLKINPQLVSPKRKK